MFVTTPSFVAGRIAGFCAIDLKSIEAFRTTVKNHLLKQGGVIDNERENHAVVLEHARKPYAQPQAKANGFRAEGFRHMKTETIVLQKMQAKKQEPDELIRQLNGSLKDLEEGRVRKFSPSGLRTNPQRKKLRDDVLLQLKLGLEDVTAGRIKRVR